MITKYIERTLEKYDVQDIYKYILIYIGIVAVIFFALGYRHYSAVSTSTRNMKKLNKERIQTEQILTDYQELEYDKGQFQDILDKTRDFRIIEAYNQIIKKLNLQDSVTSEPEPVQDKVDNYTEQKLAINLNSISTKQLVELLDEVQKYERLYTKELTITHKPKDQAIDVVLIIATLEPTETT
jgi:HJR/Mrr/RecB family endonuclease